MSLVNDKARPDAEKREFSDHSPPPTTGAGRIAKKDAFAGAEIPEGIKCAHTALALSSVRQADYLSLTGWTRQGSRPTWAQTASDSTISSQWRPRVASSFSGMPESGHSCFHKLITGDTGMTRASCPVSSLVRSSFARSRWQMLPSRAATRVGRLLLVRHSWS